MLRQKLVRVLGVLFAAAFVMAGLVAGGAIVDVIFPDASSDNARLVVDTKEVAPGDEVVLDLGTRGQFMSARASLGTAPLHDVSLSDDLRFSVAIPAEQPVGDLRLRVEVDVQVRVEKRRVMNTVYYQDERRIDHLEVMLPIRSPASLAARRWMFRAAALTSWIAVSALAYVLSRWPLGGLPVKKRRTNKREVGNPYSVIMLAFLAIAIPALVGDIVFVRPLLRTLAPLPRLAELGIQALWAAAIALALWRGLHSQARDLGPAFWTPVSLRAVVGNASAHGYRDVASTLPAWLAREASPLTATRISEVLEGAGYQVTRKRRLLQVTRDGISVMRIVLTGQGPWSPASLRAWIPETGDPAPLVAALAGGYGPLELSSDQRR